MRRKEGQRKHLGLAVLIECSVPNHIRFTIYLFLMFSYEKKKTLSGISYKRDIFTQILSCEHDVE